MSSRRQSSGDYPLLLVVALPIATLVVAAIIWLLVARASTGAPGPDCGPWGCEDRAGGDVAGGAARRFETGAGGRPIAPDAAPDAAAAFATPEEEEPLECRRARDCVLATNYNVCCPCTIAILREIVARSDCMFPAEGAPPRPEECGVGCHPEACAGCPAEPRALDCRNGQCVTLYTGECTPGEPSCSDGRICEIVEGEATCVEDPSECDTDDDCRQRGYECRDWAGAGIRTCWHPESTCRVSMSCPYHWFCEDPEDDGIFACVDGGEDCHPQLADLECGEGRLCPDPDGDGRGTCADP